MMNHFLKNTKNLTIPSCWDFIKAYLKGFLFSSNTASTPDISISSTKQCKCITQVYPSDMIRLCSGNSSTLSRTYNSVEMGTCWV